MRTMPTIRGKNKLCKAKYCDFIVLRKEELFIQCINKNGSTCYRMHGQVQNGRLYIMYRSSSQKNETRSCIVSKISFCGFAGNHNLNL